MRAKLLTSALVLLATAFAGCVGEFEIQQTEPLRIQVDGDSQDARLAANDSGGQGGAQATEKREFRIDTEDDVEQVVVVVEVKNVEIEGDDRDDDMGDDDDNATSSPTDDNETMNDTSRKAAVVLVIIEDRDTGEKLAEQEVEASESSNKVELDVDVKGKNNVVIVTQAVQGVADVNVAAMGSSAGGGGTGGTGGGATMTTGNTTSPSPTTTTSS